MNLRSKIQNLKESSQDGVTLKNILGEYKSDNRTNVSISSSLFSVGFDEKKKRRVRIVTHKGDREDDHHMGSCQRKLKGIADGVPWPIQPPPLGKIKITG